MPYMAHARPHFQVHVHRPVQKFTSPAEVVLACYLQCLQSLVDSITETTQRHLQPVLSNAIGASLPHTCIHRPAYVRAVLARAWKHDVYTSPDVFACVYLYVHVACVLPSRQRPPFGRRTSSMLTCS